MAFEERNGQKNRQKILHTCNSCTGHDNTATDHDKLLCLQSMLYYSFVN